MKVLPYKFLCLFIILFFNYSLKADQGNEKFIIKEMVQEVSFDISPDDELIATYKTIISVKLATKIPGYFYKTLIVDENSTIDDINSTNTLISKTISNYESDGIFHSDLKIYNIAFPVPNENRKVTLEYSKKFFDYKFWDPLFFNDYYQIENSSIIINVPSWLDLDVIPWNFDNHNISVENKQLKNKKIFTYHLENPQASFQVEGEPRRSKYSPHLILIPNYINNDIEPIRLMNDASDLYAWYHSLVKIIGNENEILKSKVSELIDGKKTDEDKLKSIYYWVQDNIKYIAFEEGIMGFKPENCQTVYNNKYGDCKGMANLTKEMLQLAGFDARLTWIGTNDLPYTYDIPSLIVDNHMICSVMLNDKRIYLDATEKYADLYNHADRIQGKQVLIENDDDFIIEKIPFSKSEDERRLVKNTFWIEENKLIGSGSVSYAGNQKTRILNELSSVRQKDRKNKLIKDLIKHDKNVRFATHSEVSIKNRDSNLQYNYELEVDHRIIDIENELYINLELEFPFQDFSMDDERKVPYDFRKTFYLVDLIKFKIPENHSLKYLPEKVDEKNEKYEFELSFEQIENEIIYKKKITVNNSILQVSDFAKWNETITDLNTFYADQIILEKN